MAPKFSYTCASVFTVIFYLSSIYICHAQNVPSNEKQIVTTSALDFLKNLNGTYKGDAAKGLAELKNYLADLGYIDNNVIGINDDRFDDALEAAIKKYQEFFYLNITGALNQETVAALSLPRCGVPDYFHPNNGTNNETSSFYSFRGTVWPSNKRTLTYSIRPAYRQFARWPLEGAFDEWEKHSPFLFEDEEDYYKADIRIGFYRRAHGDGVPFDGPGGRLAHAFPPTNGRVHFDADEKWNKLISVVKAGEYDLLSVALHELGHTLGLGHSRDPKAIMYPSIKPGVRKHLNGDDIAGIKKLYPH